VASTSYSTLKFSMRASAVGQRYSVGIIGSDGSFIGTQIPLDRTTTGDPVAGGWKSYSIPVGAGGFNLAGRPIKGVVIQDNAGTVQPLAWVDELRLE
jgi:hypothetical protein